MNRTVKKKQKSRRVAKPHAPDATEVVKQTNETGDAGAVPRVLKPELWPRSFDYSTGFNTEFSPRATQSVSFQMMRNLAENCDLVRIALQMRKDQIRGLRWDVTVKPGGDAKTLEPRRVKIRDFFIRPDPLNDMLFHEWIAAWLEDLLVLDAGCLLMLRDRAGRLIGLPQVDGACYSADTEVLTGMGWKRFPEIDIQRDVIATRNRDTHQFQWQKGTYLHEAEWEGNLCNFKSRSLDLLVSPNHRMLVSDRRGLWGKREKIVTATVAIHKKGHGIPATSKWVGQELATFTLPPLGKARGFSCNGDDFAAFMGMYLSEGSLGKRDIRISQQKPSKGFAAFWGLLGKVLGRQPFYNGNVFVFKNSQLHCYLKQFGVAHEKYVPDAILNMSKRQLAVFWNYYVLGDGWIDANRQGIKTSSREMADDMQEIAQKIGRSASVSAQPPRRDCTIRGRVIKKENIHTSYIVRLRSSAYQIYDGRNAKTPKAKIVPYSGKIYCVSVPNEIVYVRRNGKPAWCGNTIKPVLNASGYCPKPPLPAYVQVIKGQVTIQLTRNDLLYSTYNPRSNSAYGLPPTEMVITTAHLALKRQLSAITYQTDGSIPDYLIGAPPGWTPDQIKTVEQSLNDYLSGNWAKRHKFKLVPAGMEPHAMKQPDFTTQVDEWLARIIGAAFGVAPHLLLRQRTKQQAETLESQQTDIGLDPLRRFIGGLLTERVIRDQFGESQLQFTWTSDKEENEALAVSKAKTYIPLGVLGGDEIREDAGRLPLGIPPFIQMPNGVLFLTPKVIRGIASGEIEMINQDGGFRVTEPPSGTPQPSGGNAPPIPSPPASGTPPVDDSAKLILVENELAQWRRTALADLKRGKPFRDFTSHYLSAETIESVRTGLGDCCDESAVKELFAGLQPA